MRNRSASQRFADAPLGHHGPSVNCAAVSFTRPEPIGPREASRDAGVGDPSLTKMQFSPGPYAPTATADGFGPYDVHGPIVSESAFFISGGCGSPKYSNVRPTTLSATGTSGFEVPS